MSREVGELPARPGDVAVIASRFNLGIVERLVEGALDELERHGARVGPGRVNWVPGAFELPQAATRIAATGTVEAIVALGAVIRGGTPHFDYVCAPCAQGLMDVSVQYRLPVAFGVLTCDSEQQALARAGGEHGNKGAEAALAALQTLHTLHRLGPRA